MGLFDVIDDLRRKPKQQQPVNADPFTLRPLDLGSIPTEQQNVSVQDLLSRANPPDEIPKTVLRPVEAPVSEPSDRITLRQPEPIPPAPITLPNEQVDPVFGHNLTELQPPASSVSSDINLRAPLLAPRPPQPPRELQPVEPVPGQPSDALALRPPAAGPNQPAAVGQAFDPDPLASRLNWESANNGWLHDPANKVVNTPSPGMNHADKKGRLKDALLKALISAGEETKAAGGIADWRTLGAGLGGFGGGLVHPQWNEELKRQNDTAQSDFRLKSLQQQRSVNTEDQYKKAETQYQLQRPDIALETIQQRREAAQGITERLKMREEFRKGEAKPFIDEQGKVWMQFLKDPSRPMEPVENPVTHVQETVPGEEGIEWKDPNTGNTVLIKAKQSVMPSATIAAGNATRQQSAERDNAEKAWQTDKENINNHMEYQKQVNGLITAAVSAESGLTADPGTQSKVNDAYQDLIRLQNEPLPADAVDVDKAREQRIKRIQELTDTIQSGNEKILNDLAKSEAGKAKAAEIRAQIKQLKQPQKLTYTPYKPVQVGGGVSGKPVPKSKDPLGLFQ